MVSISVIMCTYNQALYLREAIDSILNQSFKEFELIVIDDASNDETPDLLASYSDPRLHVITNPKNLGPYPSANIGIQAAQGTYIARLDSDDIAHPDRLEKQYKIVQDDPEIGFVYSDWDFKNEIDEYDIPVNLPPRTQIELQKSILLQNVVGCHSTFFFRKDLGLYSQKYKYAADYELVCRAAFESKTHCIPEKLVSFRRHEKSISSQYQTDQNNLAAQISYEAFVKYLGSRNLTNTEYLYFQNLTDSEYFYFHNTQPTQIKWSDLLSRLKKIKTQNHAVRFHISALCVRGIKVAIKQRRVMKIIYLSLAFLSLWPTKFKLET